MALIFRAFRELFEALPHTQTAGPTFIAKGQPPQEGRARRRSQTPLKKKKNNPEKEGPTHHL